MTATLPIGTRVACVEHDVTPHPNRTYYGEVTGVRGLRTGSIWYDVKHDDGSYGQYHDRDVAVVDEEEESGPGFGPGVR